MKTKTIKLRSLGNLTGHNRDDRFVVDTITDSLEYLPGQVIHRGELQVLCDLNQWKVTVVEPKGSN